MSNIETIFERFTKGGHFIGKFESIIYAITPRFLKNHFLNWRHIYHYDVIPLYRSDNLITADHYPVLAKTWDNEEDDIFNAL